MARTRLAMPVISSGLTCAKCRAALGPLGLHSQSHLPRSDQAPTRRCRTGAQEGMDPLRLDGGQSARGNIVPTRTGPCRGLTSPPGGHLRRMPCAPHAGTH
eukprot:3358975-Alexandrium_andersonii.AAC.1